MALNDITTNVQQQIADLVRNAQDFTVEGVRNWAGAVERNLSPESRQRLGDTLPRADEAVDRAFGVARDLVPFPFALEVLDNQRQFAHRLVEAVGAGVTPAA